ncbi:hypothetical protein [Kocuria palustris]|uniref:hypothetical protein n=1 Tax=Kocuria palustris TaxID=71999 RepID=UPI0011A85158|nr:hypothetical protein [Kocuria palustris]
MSALSRIAVLAAGAAVGAAAGRAAGGDEGRRALGQAVRRSRAAIEPAPGGDDQPVRENRLGSRVLRIAQDIRSGMDQAEAELRGQLSRPAGAGRRPGPAGVASRSGAEPPHAEAPGLEGHGTGLPGQDLAAEPTVIDHDERPRAAVDGSDGPGR